MLASPRLFFALSIPSCLEFSRSLEESQGSLLGWLLLLSIPMAGRRLPGKTDMWRVFGRLGAPDSLGEGWRDV